MFLSFFCVKQVKAQEQLYYVHSDHLGSTTTITNQQGQVVNQQIYYPYGTTRADYQLPSVDTSITERLYTSQISDQDSTGLYYYNARYYNPTLGIFTQADKVESQVNRYTYVNSNPVNYIDPTGNQPFMGWDDWLRFYLEFLIRSQVPEDMYSAWLQPGGYARRASPAEGGGIVWSRNDEYLPINPQDMPTPITSINADEYTRIIDWLNVDDPTNVRYQKNDFYTFCNVFAWDVANSYRVEEYGNKSAPLPRWLEGSKVDANQLYSWFKSQEAIDLGWVSADSTTAQLAANRGILTFGVRENTTGGSGHIFVVVPGVGIVIDGVYYPMTAQAGSENWGPESGMTDYNSIQTANYYTSTQYYFWDPLGKYLDILNQPTYHYGGGGCFPEDTKVLMANGLLQEISSVKRGDLVISFDVENKTQTVSRVDQLLVHSKNNEGHFVINNNLKITPSHLVWVENKKSWIRAGDLKQGDLLLNPDGVLVEIESIKKIEITETVYNLQLQGRQHNFFAEGVLVHNKKML